MNIKKHDAMRALVAPSLVDELAPRSVLRAGINLSNFLLVTGKAPNGDPQGVAPDMAAAIADTLGVGLALVPFTGPGLLADAAADDVWDIGLIGAEPARAEKIAFSSAYVEIEATYLAKQESKFAHALEVDAAGVRIAVSRRTAYDLWLQRNLKHATLVHGEGFEGALSIFADGGADVLAALLPALLNDVQKMPGTRILPGRFTAIQQAIGTHKRHRAGAAFLQAFSQYAINSGLAADLIAKHRVKGLNVAPPHETA